MTYDYLEEMKKDILTAIRDNYKLSDFEDREEFEERLYDDLLVDDSVTGNASGSYTFSREKAREYLFSDTDTFEAVWENKGDLGITDAQVAEHFADQDWEWFDVITRCHLLPCAISLVLDELEAEFKPDQEKEERVAQAV